MTTKTITILSITTLLIILVCLSYPRIKTFFAIDSCLDQGEKWDYKRGNCDQEAEIKTSKQTLNNVQTENLEVLNFPCAVLIRPNSEKIEKLKRENPEDDYNTIVDDNEYYMGISFGFLDSTMTKIILRDASGILNFKTLTDKTYNVNLDSTYWGIILFNGKEKQVKADMTFINDDFKSYMENKLGITTGLRNCGAKCFMRL